MTMVGRPLTGMILWMVLMWPGGMASMNVLRRLGVLNIACVAYMYCRWLRIWGVAPFVALAISVVVITQPPAFATTGRPDRKFPPGRDHARSLAPPCERPARRGGLALLQYYFGPKDVFTYSVIVGEKPGQRWTT